MSKLLLALSSLVLIFLGIGTSLAPNNPMFWLASSAITYQWIRVILGCVLLSLLVTNPPRQWWLRMLAGSAAAIIGFWAIEQTYDFRMQFLDTLAFLSTSLAIIITALEHEVALFKREVELNKTPVYTICSRDIPSLIATFSNA